MSVLPRKTKSHSCPTIWSFAVARATFELKHLWGWGTMSLSQCNCSTFVYTSLIPTLVYSHFVYHSGPSRSIARRITVFVVLPTVSWLRTKRALARWERYAVPNRFVTLHKASLNCSWDVCIKFWISYQLPWELPSAWIAFYDFFRTPTRFAATRTACVTQNEKSLSTFEIRD